MVKTNLRLFLLLSSVSTTPLAITPKHKETEMWRLFCVKKGIESNISAGIKAIDIAINTRNPECTFESEISLRNKPLKLNIEFDGCIDLYLINKAAKRGYQESYR